MQHLVAPGVVLFSYSLREVAGKYHFAYSVKLSLHLFNRPIASLTVPAPYAQLIMGLLCRISTVAVSTKHTASVTQH